MLRGVKIRDLCAAAGVIAILVAAVPVAPALATPARNGSSSTLGPVESAVLARLNQIRRDHGLVPLRLNARLTAAATHHSAAMLARGFFSHDSAAGVDFSSWIVRYYGPLRYGSWSAGENLVWSPGTLDAARAVEMWMHSAEHRDNILRPRWREIGIAALYSPDAPGTFGDQSVTLIATDFGVRHL
jgi:uncharacterized protein YkwD